MLAHSLYRAIVGNSDWIFPTTLYKSMNKDIVLLESPDFEVSIARKIAITSRMRRTFRILSPSH